MAIARYRYNGKEKRCWLVRESIATTYEEAMNDFASYADIPTDALNEETFEEEDGSFSYQYELPKIKDLSTKTVFKHGEAELTIDELAPNIISCTLRNVKEPLDTVWHWPNVDYDKENNAIDNSYDYGMTIWDPEKEVYKTEFGLPKVFNFYWDEYNQNYEFYFYFEFSINSVDKDKDEKKPWFYYGWDFTPAISNFIYKTLSPYIGYRKGTEKDREEIERPFKMFDSLLGVGVGSDKLKDNKELNGLKKQIVQIIGQNGETTRPWERSGYPISFWRHMSLGNYPSELKGLQKDLGSEFFELVQMTPYNQREKLYQQFLSSKDFTEKTKLHIQFLQEAEKLERLITGKGKIPYVPKEIVEYDFGLETKENWEKREGEMPGLVISFLPTMFYGRKVARNEKLTGTKWFEKLWEVFGQHGVPIVLRCYEGFIYKNLQLNHREWWEKISVITNLPACINGQEVGGSNMLVYFNCPWLEKEGVDGSINRIKWDLKLADDRLKYKTFFRCWFQGGMTYRQLHWLKNPKLDPRFKNIPDEAIDAVIQEELNSIITHNNEQK